MAVGIKLGSITDEMGSAAFFHGFFSTVAGNLEPGGWGSRFPVLMNKLYGGALSQADATAALAELAIVQHELAALPVERLIWDSEDPTKRPPWGDNIAPTIVNLSHYFVTSSGRDLIAVLREIAAELNTNGGTAEVVTY